MSKIAFIKSDDRSYNIERCLSLIKSDITSRLKNVKKVVIKPNCVTDDRQLAASHVQALDALLRFISPYVSSQISLAEGTAIGNTLTAFKNYGYLNLQEKYDLTIIDLNYDQYAEIELVAKNGKPFRARFAKTLLESDYLISISPPKTHDTVIYTGAIKNVAVGGLLRPNQSLIHRLSSKFLRLKNNKNAIHQGFTKTNENIYRLFRNIPLRLAILDAYETMEGNGPVDGDMVPAHYAMASADPLAADWLACQLMGIDVSQVGYLQLLGANRIDHLIVGDYWQHYIRPFRLHSNFIKTSQ